MNATPSLNIVLSLVVLSAAGRADDDAPADVVIAVVDVDGEPVAGAQIGSILFNTDPGNESGELQLWLIGERRGPAVSTGDDGIARIPSDLLFWNDDDRPRPIMAVSSDLTRMGVVVVQPDAATKPVSIVLAETCRVVVRPSCPRLVELGRGLESTIVYSYLQDLALMEQQSMTGEHVFRLPPGTYKLSVYGSDTYSMKPELVVAPGDREREIAVELPATRLAEHLGQPAPELREIKAWRGGDPVTLAELRGKVVLLDFWGYWCGPCVGRMPDLFALHDRYHEQGLEIIAVHDDSVADAAELESHLVEIRKEFWDGRDLPFRVAIDGGGERDVPGRAAPVRGATTAEYGISGWPTYLLIDRQGVIQSKIGPHRPDHQQLIERLLAEPADIQRSP